MPAILAIVALVLFGLTNFLWKIAAENRTYGPSYLLIQGTIYTLVAIGIHLLQKQPFTLSAKMVGFASLGGACAIIAAFATMLALSLGGQASIIFPIAGLGLMVPVILSIIIFHESVTAMKLLGIGLAISSVIILSRQMS